MNFGHWGSAALRKLGAVPEGFELFEIRGTRWGTMLRGGVPSVTKTGKNKGRKRWTGPYLTALVSDKEYAAELVRYEAETSKCHECTGEAWVVYGWSHIEGHFWKECPRCKGSGKAPGKETT